MVGKAVAGGVVAAALVIVVAAFIGIGFGVGALSTTTPNGQTIFPTWHNDTGGSGGAIQPNVYVQLGTLPLITAMTTGGQSTTLTFGAQVFSNNNCANAGQPAYSPGLQGADPAYFEVQFLGASGNAQSFTALVDGHQQTGTAVFASNNGTFASSSTDNNIYACFHLSTGNVQTTNFGGNPFFLHTLRFVGLVGAGTLKISFPATGSLCGHGSIPQLTNAVCDQGAQAAYGSGGAGNYPGWGGSWYTTSYVDIPVFSAGASASLVGSGPWFNGGTVQVTVSTGYAGDPGYTLEVDNPTGRSSGSGALASGWGPQNPQSVANDLTNSIFTFDVPTDASQNCTISLCNEFQIVLKSSLLGQSLPFPVDISPEYAPTLPGISYTTGSGALYPTPGDTVTLTLSASSNGSANQVDTFLLFVFYLPAGVDVHSAVPCDSNWVTPCTGATLTAQSTGSGSGQTWTASLTFTVNSPINAVSIGVRAQAETHQQQSSGISYRQVDLNPVGCSPGQSCNPSTANLAMWGWLGPTLLVVAIALAAALGLIFLTPLVFRAFIVVAGTAGIIVVLVGAFFFSWFAPGGVLG